MDKQKKSVFKFDEEQREDIISQLEKEIVKPNESVLRFIEALKEMRYHEKTKDKL